MLNNTTNIKYIEKDSQTNSDDILFDSINKSVENKLNEDATEKHNSEEHNSEEHNSEEHNSEEHNSEDNNSEEHNSEDNNSEDNNSEDNEILIHETEDDLFKKLNNLVFFEGINKIYIYMYLAIIVFNIIVINFGLIK